MVVVPQARGLQTEEECKGRLDPRVPVLLFTEICPADEQIFLPHRVQDSFGDLRPQAFCGQTFLEKSGHLLVFAWPHSFCQPPSGLLSLYLIQSHPTALLAPK